MNNNTVYGVFVCIKSVSVCGGIFWVFLRLSSPIEIIRCDSKNAQGTDTVEYQCELFVVLKLKVVVSYRTHICVVRFIANR